MVIPSTPYPENTGEAPRPPPKLAGGVGGRAVGGNREGLPRPPRQRKCVSLSDPRGILGIVVRVGGGRRSGRRNPLDPRARCESENRVGGRSPPQPRRQLRQRPSRLSSYPADAGPAQRLTPRIRGGKTTCQVDTPLSPHHRIASFPSPTQKPSNQGPSIPTRAPAFFTGHHWLTLDGRGTQAQRGQDLCLKLHSKSEQKLGRSETCPPPTISGFVVPLTIGATSSPPTLVPELLEARRTPCPFGGVVRVARQGSARPLGRPL